MDRGAPSATAAETQAVAAQNNGGQDETIPWECFLPGAAARSHPWSLCADGCDARCLAGAMPADKYTWRPAGGVRSVSEVYMHVAAANYNLPRVLGTPPPAGFNARGFDTSVTEKAKVIETLKQSFAHLRQAVLNMSDADVEKKLKWFGAENTYRGVLLFIIRHMAEHLGQSIAYARINGVVPPWTEEQQQQQPQKPKQ